MSGLTAKRLRHLLAYDQKTGLFKWAVSAKRVKRGDAAGRLNPSNGYIEIGVDGRRYLAHRLAWLYVHGVWPTDCIDHIDRNATNNRIDNLRLATISQNGWNKGIGSNNTSGVKGVSWIVSRRRWQATIKKDGKNINLGWFVDIGEATNAYRCAAERLAGEFFVGNV